MFYLLVANPWEWLQSPVETWQSGLNACMNLVIMGDSEM
jgi:hypothetical protein